VEKWNNPYIDNLVGLPEEQKDLESEWREYVLQNIQEVGGRKIEDFEIEKNQQDIELINRVESSVNDVLLKYGRNKIVSLPLDNIHLLKEGGTHEYVGHSAGGARSTIQQSIVVDRFKSDVQFSLVLFHELLHVKSYTALQIIPSTKEKPAEVIPYRTGISVRSRDGKTEYLGNIEEAIVGYLTKEYYEGVISQDPYLKDELSKIDRGEISINLSREKEQQKLDSIIDQILVNEKDGATTRESILNTFIDAQLNGNLTTIGRLITRAYGADALKKIDVQHR